MEKIRTQIEHAIDAARIGRVFPKKWPTRNTGRHAKEPLEKGYQANATCDPQAIRETWTKHPKANIGILVEGFFVLDVEHDGIEPLNAFLTQTGSTLPATITVISGREGLHYYFRCHGLEIASRSQLPGIPRVEILGHGANVTAAGSRLVAHPLVPEQGLYRYAAGCSPDEIEMAEAPQWLLDLATRKDLRSIKPVQNKLNGPIDLQELAEALLCISPDIERNLWRNVVWAIHCATNGSEEGYKAAKNWSQRGQKWDRKGFDRIWQDAAKDRGRTVGIGSIYKLAQDNGWNRPWFDDPLLSVEEGREQLNRVINQALNERKPGYLVVNATPGLGKTHAVIMGVKELVKQNPQFLVHFYVPEFNLGHQVAADFKRYAPEIETVVIQGRNERNCNRSDLAQQVAELKLSVSKTLCGEGTTFECPHAKSCPYLAQKAAAEQAQVVIMPHQRLTLPATVEGPGKPDLAIIDEDCTSSLLRISNGVGLHNLPPDLRQALESPNPMEALKSFDFGTHLHDLDVLRKAPPFVPSDNDETIRRALKMHTKRKPAYWLITALQNDVQAGMTEIRSASRIETPNKGEEGGTIVHWRLHVHTKPKRLEDVPVIILDGTAQSPIYKEIFGDSCQVVKIRCKTSQTVIQVRNKTFSKKQLERPENQALVRQIVEACPGAVVFGSESDRPILEGLDVDFAPHGRLRGSNAWAGKAISIQIGRPEPGEADALMRAKAIFFRSASPIRNGFLKSKRIYRTKSGVRSPAKVRIAEDHRVQAVVETIREGSLAQNLHRTRPINHENTTHLLITSVPVECEVAALLTPEELLDLVRLPSLLEKHGSLPTPERQLEQVLGLTRRESRRKSNVLRHMRKLAGVQQVSLSNLKKGVAPLHFSDMAENKHVSYNLPHWTTPLEALTVRDSLDEVRADLVKLYKCPIHVAWADDVTNAVPFEVPAIVEQAQPLAAVVGADSRYIPPDAKNHRIATFADEEAAYEAMERAALMESSTLNRDQADILAIHEAKGSQVLDDGWRPVNLQFPPDFDWSSVKPSTSKI
ncbi:MAG: bifunctional DNA primase/polymerase, partial [Acidobacteria bacterium]|nr:bifunctional DNA primase/polymerase [Acidobacteriota bacterium]